MMAFLATVFITQSFREHAVLKGHSSQVSSVSFSFNNEMLVTGSSDHTIKIWDVASGREQSTLGGHAAALLSVRFSSNGETLTSVDFRGKMIS